MLTVPPFALFRPCRAAARCGLSRRCCQSARLSLETPQGPSRVPVADFARTIRPRSPSSPSCGTRRPGRAEKSLAAAPVRGHNRRIASPVRSVCPRTGPLPGNAGACGLHPPQQSPSLSPGGGTPPGGGRERRRTTRDSPSPRCYCAFATERRPGSSVAACRSVPPREAARRRGALSAQILDALYSPWPCSHGVLQGNNLLRNTARTTGRSGRSHSPRLPRAVRARRTCAPAPGRRGTRRRRSPSESSSPPRDPPPRAANRWPR